MFDIDINANGSFSDSLIYFKGEKNYFTPFSLACLISLYLYLYLSLCVCFYFSLTQLKHTKSVLNTMKSAYIKARVLHTKQNSTQNK